MSIKKPYRLFQFEGMITENNGSVQGGRGNLITLASKKQCGEFTELRRPSNVVAPSTDVRAVILFNVAFPKELYSLLLNNHGCCSINKL